MKRRLVIIGSGPAGQTAAIYAARANLEPLVLTGFLEKGGQLTTTTDVENYPGFPEGILGPDLVERFEKQAVRYGAEMVAEDVLKVDLTSRPFHVMGTKTKVEADALIIATGASAKRLDVVGTRDGEFWQKGVTACATCDGPNPIFRDKPLMVIGGGDTACEEALFLTKFGSRVYLVLRRDTFRASQIMQKRVMAHEKIEVIYSHQLKEVLGEQSVTSALLVDSLRQKERQLAVAGVFFAIGHLPNTQFLHDQLLFDKNGYIVVDPGTTKTSVEGVFAAGDVQDHRYRQAVTAAGTGCMAAMEAEAFLEESTFV